MKLNKPNFWDYKKPNFLTYILLPLTFPILIRNFFAKSFSKEKFHKIKTVCVGNIYVGGTGKTPLSIEIIKILNNLNYKTCFIKKKYPNQLDEQKLLKSSGKLFCEKDRKNAVNKAINENFNVAIFDDGLQDKKIKYDISIVCFNEKIGFGNGFLAFSENFIERTKSSTEIIYNKVYVGHFGFLLPSGPLRENAKSLKEYDVVFLNGNNLNNEDLENKIKKEFAHLKVFKSVYSLTNLNELDINERYLAFAGIGNFDNFCDMLKRNNLNIVNAILYPDHYNYKDTDIKKIRDLAKFSKAKIITTEKDYLRLNDENKKNINVAKIKLNIKNKDNFINLLKDYL